MTYYDVLGVERNASQEEIKDAYRKLLKAFHPDNYSGDKDFATKQTEKIIEAYSVLSNLEKKASYDAQLNAPCSGNTTEQGNYSVRKGNPTTKTDDDITHSPKSAVEVIKSVLLSLVGVVLAWIAYTVCAYVMTIIYAILVSIPVIGPVLLYLMSFPADRGWMMVVMIVTSSVGLAGVIASKFARMAHADWGRHLFCLSMIVLGVVSLISGQNLDTLEGTIVMIVTAMLFWNDDTKKNKT